MPAPLSHEEVMATRCGICTGKGERKISPKGLLIMIKEHHYKDYDLNLHPSVLCLSCELALREVAKIAREGKGEPKRRLPSTNYAELEPPRASRSRSSAGVCECGWCKASKLNGSPPQNIKNSKGIKEQVGRPKASTSEQVTDKSDKSVTNCVKCRGVLKRGHPHWCTKTSRNKNIVKIVRELSPEGQRRVVGKLIKGFAEEENVTDGGQINLFSGGRVQPITIGSKKELRQTKIEEFFRFQSNTNLSAKQTGQVASFLRKTVGSRMIEPGLERALQTRKEQLRPFFSVKPIQFQYKTKKGPIVNYERPMVSCDPPVEAFVQYVKDQRGMDEDNMELIAGLDDGNGSEKVSVLINLF